jgi:hypothetical protein
VGESQEQDQGDSAADKQVTDPEGPPVRSEGYQIQSRHHLKDACLIADKELQHFQKQKMISVNRTARPRDRTNSLSSMKMAPKKVIKAPPERIAAMMKRSGVSALFQMGRFIRIAKKAPLAP